MPIPFNPPEPVYPTFGASLGQGIQQGVTNFKTNQEMQKQSMMLDMQMKQYDLSLARFELEQKNAAMNERIKESQLKINEKILNQQGGMPNIVSDPDTGFQFVQTDTRQGPRFQPLPGQVSTEQERTRRGQFEDAKKSLDFIEKTLDDPRARELILKTGGKYANLAGIGDPLAQKLSYEIFTAADARARALTGAQINETELERYYTGLVGRMDNVEATKYKIGRQREFYDSLLGQYTKTGSRTKTQGGPTDTSLGEDLPSAGTVKQQNKKTGEWRHSLDGGKTWKPGRP